MVGIYKIESPSGKVYIGKSINIENRHSHYKRGHSKEQPFLHHSLQKYGWDNHKISILEECEIEVLDEREKYYIKLYNSVENGLNLTYGGDGGVKSNTTKNKMSTSHTGMKKPWAGLKKLSKTHRESLTQGRINTLSPVYQYDLEGNYIQEFKNPKQTSQQLKLNNGYLFTILDDFRKTLGGFRFTRTKYDNLPPILKHTGNRKQVLQYDKQNNFIKEWDTCKQASKSLGIPVQNISSCCRGEIKTCNNSIWKYKK
jgi:group I intron endonuclease